MIRPSDIQFSEYLIRRNSTAGFGRGASPKDAKTKILNPEELAQERAIKRIHIQQWMESRASQLTLADVFHADIAEILRMRAKAFPVSETAMLPPFIAAMASVMGTRYKVQIKKGWTETDGVLVSAQWARPPV